MLRFFIAWPVVFVVWMIGSMVVHGMLLHADYTRLQNLFRPEEEAAKYMHLMLLAHVVMAGAFVKLYARGVEPNGWFLQGLTFGITMALFGVVPTYTIYHVVQPMPVDTVLKQIAYDGALVVLLGVLVAAMYRNAARPTA